MTENGVPWALEAQANLLPTRAWPPQVRGLGPGQSLLSCIIVATVEGLLPFRNHSWENF